MKIKSPVYSYYYPISQQCETLSKRASLYNTDLVDETKLCRDAKPLFGGHIQPNTYTYNGDPSVVSWDDSDINTMQAQIELSQEYGVDGFIFDTYVGCKKGCVSQEKTRVIDESFLKCRLGKTAYACMMVFGSPRAVLPVPPYFEETERYYDRTKQTIEVMVDYLAKKHWQHDNYIHILDRPYVSLFTSDMRVYSNAPDDNTMSHAAMIEYLKTYSWRKYKIEPYLATVCLRAAHAISHLAGGADSMTGYGFLPDFAESFDRPIQSYREQVERRIADWNLIQEKLSKPYIPPVVVGWDASPRGFIPEGSTFEDVIGMYPFTPIVTNSKADDFGVMLKQQRQYLINNIPTAERYTPVTAWNEITEGAALLPKVLDNGAVDISYLEKIRDLRRRYDF